MTITRTLTAIIAATVIAVVTVVAPSLAHADGPMSLDAIARARMLDDRGRAAHDAADYPTAIAAFTEAYVLAPSAGVLFNLAQAYRLNGNCAQAALIYRRYLASDPDGDNREVATMQLAAVERCALAEPSPWASSAATGPSRTTASAASANSSSDERAAAETRGRHKREAGIAFVVAGVALAVSSIYFAVQAHDDASDVSASYAAGGAWSTISATDSHGRRDAAVADGLAIGGGAALVTGGALYALGRRVEQVPLDVSVSAHGAKASWTWHF